MGIAARPLGELGSSAVRLLLDLLDQPDSILAGPVMADYFAVDGARLLRAGLLVADGHEPADSTGEHNDAPVALTWSDEEQSFGYFNPLAGWVRVEPSRIGRYRVDIAAVAHALLGGDTSGPMAELVPDLLWDLGSIQVPHRRRRVPILLARRLFDALACREIRKAFVERPGNDRILLVAGRSSEIATELPPGNTPIPVANVLVGDGTFALNLETLSAHLDGRRLPAAAGPLVVTGDGREVRFYGEVFRFVRGEQQRRIIRAISDRYFAGHDRTAWAEIVAQLDLRPNARFRDYFKKCRPPVLGRLLIEEAGMVGFIHSP